MGGDWLASLIIKKAAAGSNRDLLFLQYLTFRHVGVGRMIVAVVSGNTCVGERWEMEMTEIIAVT